MSVYQVRFDGRWPIGPGFNGEPSAACLFTSCVTTARSTQPLPYAARSSFVGLVQHGIRNQLDPDEAERRADALLARHGRDVVVGFVETHWFGGQLDAPVEAPVDLDSPSVLSALLEQPLPTWSHGQLVVDGLDVIE